MASCSHKNHKVDSVKYRVARKQYEQMDIAMGWNPIKKHWEICDSGMFITKRTDNRKRPHSTPKKKTNKEMS